MTKKILSISLLVAICSAALFSCTKSTSTQDYTRNYFPLLLGKQIVYDVDSIYYTQSDCSKYHIKSQMKYVISDTFTDRRGFKPLPAYILDVYSRPYDGAVWTPLRVIYLTPNGADLMYTQDQTQYVKLKFPLTEGVSWKGNLYANTSDSDFAFLKNWDYTCQNLHLSYNNGLKNFDNTVTILEADQSVNYPSYDSLVDAYRTYAKEVYAYNVGMIYKEWTHWTYKPNHAQCVNGYSVIMRAIDYN